MKIMIVGTPDWIEFLPIHASLTTINVTMRVDEEPVTLIHGNETKVDYIAEEAAKELGWGIEAYPGSSIEDEMGRARRTVRMLEADVQYLIAFYVRNPNPIRHAWITAGKMKIPRRAHLVDGSVSRDILGL